MRKTASLLKTCDPVQVGATLGAHCDDGVDQRMYTAPLTLRNKTWLLLEKKFGTEQFHVLDRYDPERQGCTIHARTCSFERREFKVQIRDKVLTSQMPAPTFWVFDSDAQELYFIHPAVFPATLLERASK